MLAIANSFFNRAIEAIRYPFSGWITDPSRLDYSSKLLLQKVLFAANGHIAPLGNPALSGHSIGSAFTVSDYTFAYRSVIDLLNSFQVGGLFRETFGTTGATMVYQASGLASGLGAIVGAVQMQRAIESIAFSNAINDKRGALLGRVSVIKDAASIGGALGFTGFRIMGITDAIKNINIGAGSASLMGRVTYGTLFVGLVLFTLFFALLGVVSGIKIYEGSKLKKKLQGLDLQKQIALLERQMKADPKAVYNKLIRKLGTMDAAQNKLIDLALSSGKEQLRAVLKELNIPKASEAKLNEAMEKIAGNRQELINIGLTLMTQAVQAKKEAKMGRILNKEGLDALKALANAPELEKLAKLETILSGVNKKMVENGILTAIFAFGVITLIASIVFSGGTGLIVAAILMLAFSLIAMGLDGYYLVQSYKSEQPATHDKKMLLVSSAVAIISFLTIAALVASGVVTMGTVPLVIGVVLTLIWLGQNGLTWAIMNRNERLHQEKNPTLELFLEELKKNGDRITKMHENLPPEVKKVISHTLERNKMIEATKELIRKVEEAKKNRLEALRNALAPLLIQ